MIATILNPVGYFLEWTVARPLHYLATDSPLAPVFGGADEEDNYLYGKTNIPASMAEMPVSMNQFLVIAVVATRPWLV